VRRHTLTKKGAERGRGSHISQAGVALARQVGGSLGPFDRVVASSVPRTFETALAMGFAVSDYEEGVSALDDEVLAEVGHHDRWSWPEPFAVFARLVRQDGATARMGRTQADLWRVIAAALPEGGRALVISHGRIIEAGAVTCLPDAGHVAWGVPFRHCEGIRLTWERGEVVQFELLRVDAPQMDLTTA
jgi:broad specificity phosphatase PhoE